jgi:hypothetical protein
MAESQVLPRTVGFWGTTLFPVNGMIGAGIFALPAIMVAAVGSFAPWMMLIGRWSSHPPASPPARPARQTGSTPFDTVHRGLKSRGFSLR